jgi:hypothetical protein
MLADIINLGRNVTLVSKSGIQFMDFASRLEFKKEQPGLFLKADTPLGLVRLVPDQSGENYALPGQPREFVTSGWEDVYLNETIDLLEKVWLPIPYLRTKDATDGTIEATEGPTNWARANIRKMQDDEDPDGYTLRVCLAFDTKILDDNDQRKYLAPTVSDVNNGEQFALFAQTHQIGWFLNEPWLQEWLEEVYRDNALGRARMTLEDVQDELAKKTHLAHYMNFLAILRDYIEPPTIQMRMNDAKRSDKIPVNVDLVLDIGNSRTCGILIEDYDSGASVDEMKKRYELALRDVSQPFFVYNEPFESRVEFVKANFGKENFSAASGRNDAFLWPTISRVGPEATRFTSQRRGTEGNTGVSSPKRYLWDQAPSLHGWNLHKNRPDERAMPATVSPFTDYINDYGNALYTIVSEDAGSVELYGSSMPVFEPKYCRSSLMTFMVAEVIVQALTQINSLSQRMSMQFSDVPRRLRHLVMTLPPSMPIQERNIFKDRVEQALALVWKSLGWHEDDAGMDEEGKRLANPDFPDISMQWDEATCAQVVYLYSEIQNHFNGNANEFFECIRRPDSAALDGTKQKIRVASIDVGGGTSDVVITGFELEGHSGGNVSIIPEHIFMDGFKIAGDDILLEVLQHTIIPDIARGLMDCGILAPDVLLSRLIGHEAGDVHVSRLREQVALQVLQPLGHHVLSQYEKFVPFEDNDIEQFTISEFFERASDDIDPPSERLYDEFNEAVRDELGGDKTFDLRNVEIRLNLDYLHKVFTGFNVEIAKPLKAMCEIVHLHNCDVLLLSGRPSRLPGVKGIVRSLLPLPPDRIIPLHDYEAGNWYPFHKGGRIDDPKTTAAVGAMLCVLSKGRIPRFYFRANAFKPYSTVRYLGTMGQSNVIKEDEVIYANLDLLDDSSELEEKSFEMHGLTRLGFRQLKAERWTASQLYTLDYNGEEARQKYGDKTLEVTLKLGNMSGQKRDAIRMKEFAIQNISVKGTGNTVSSRSLKMKLNTLQGSGGDQSYWLDNGSVVDGRAVAFLKGVLK